MILGKNLSRQLVLLAPNLSVVSKKTAEALSCSKTFAGPQVQLGKFPRGNKILKNYFSSTYFRVHAISKMVSYRLFHETTLALGPYEPPEKVLDPPAFARLPARPLKFGPLCTGGRKSEVGILG